MATTSDVTVVTGSGDEAPAAEANDRPLRADARRNRLKVLDAAEALFAERGLRVQIEDIARRAGVGVGTVCRHFVTKDDLLDAVLTRSYVQLRDAAVAALDDPDGATAFESFVLGTSDFQSEHKALAEQMKEGLDLSPAAVAVRIELFDAMSQLVRRAQKAGSVRPDIGPADIGILFGGIAQAAASRVELDATMRQRYVRILLDGLRPANPSVLPGRPLEFSDVSEP
jgi:AcrR family transcriptional regulator